jgi:hypothetical protein
MMTLALASCGGGSGGGGPGGGATSYVDELGNPNFIPALGETAAVATLTFPGPAGAINRVVYSVADPDLFAVAADAIYIGRISTKKIERYCGATTPGTYIVEQEPGVGLFTLEGDQLIFFAPSNSTDAGMFRFVCSHDAVVTMDTTVGAPAVTQGFASMTIPVADGFWGLVPAFGPPKAIVHVKFDGTVYQLTAPPSTERATEPVGGAFYFHQADTVTKFDVATQGMSTVATGVSGALAAVSDKGLIMTGPPGQVVVFAKGTTPVMLPNAVAGTPGNTVAVGDFFSVDGNAAIVGGRYDLTTGAYSKATYTTPPPVPFNPVFTLTGHAYALQGDVSKLQVWTKPLGATDVMFDPATPDFTLKPYPVVPPGPSGPVALESYVDGSCVFTTGSGQGGQAPGGTAIVPAKVGPNRSLSAGRCGAASAKTLLVGYASATWYDSAFMALLRRPFFTALHVHEYTCPTPGTCSSSWEQDGLEIFESAWTLDASGTPVPLYKLATGAWPRPRTLKNFVVRHDDKLVVLAGPP